MGLFSTTYESFADTTLPPFRLRLNRLAETISNGDKAGQTLQKTQAASGLERDCAIEEFRRRCCFDDTGNKKFSLAIKRLCGASQFSQSRAGR
jgi:hypothetical protein